MEDVVEHPPREPARRRVALARVIRGDEPEPWEIVDHTMSERGTRSGDRSSCRGPCAKERIHRGPAQDDRDTHVREKPQFGLEIRLAARELGPAGPVLGRSASHRRGDVAVAQGETVVLRDRRGPVREPRAVERAEEPIPARVPREHAPRPVAAVGRGRESHDHEPTAWIAESGERSAPVRPVAERGPLVPRDPLAMRDESGAAPTRHDGFAQRVPCGGRCRAMSRLRPSGGAGRRTASRRPRRARDGARPPRSPRTRRACRAPRTTRGPSQCRCTA